MTAPPRHSVHNDGQGNYLIVGTPADADVAHALGADPGADDATILINRQIVDHHRNPKSQRLWEQALTDRADLRRRLRRAEQEIQRLKGQEDTMTNNLVWRRSSAAPVIHSSGSVEVSSLSDGTVRVRNSDHRIPVLEFSSEEWTAFLEGVDNGEFDIDTEEEGADE